MSTTPDKSSSIKNPWVRNILFALIITVFGFIFLGLTFLFNYLVFTIMDFFIYGDPETLSHWVPFLRHIVFLVLIGLISWGIFRSRFWLIVKATYLMVPTAVVLVTLGILLYPQPVLPYIIGGLLVVGVLYYFYRTRKSWQYYYSLILCAVTLMIFTLTGGEI